MIIMPANASGWFWHCLARETGLLGHLYSPGAQRGPWEWLPYALDNGAFSLWTPATNDFDEERWRKSGAIAWRNMLFWSQAAPIKPRWAIVPDRPGDADATFQKWAEYAPEVIQANIPLALAVQDGMTPHDVYSLALQPAVIAVGGSFDWKWDTVEMWAQAFPRVHVLRCNSPAKLEWLHSLGVESCDGTGWNRGDRVQTAGLEEFCRRHSFRDKTHISLAPHVCRKRADSKTQQMFA